MSNGPKFQRLGHDASQILMKLFLMKGMYEIRLSWKFQHKLIISSKVMTPQRQNWQKSRESGSLGAFLSLNNFFCTMPKFWNLLHFFCVKCYQYESFNRSSTTDILKTVFRKVLFLWSSMPSFSFVGYTLVELFRKSENWRQIYKQTSSTFYKSNDVSRRKNY